MQKSPKYQVMMPNVFLVIPLPYANLAPISMVRRSQKLVLANKNEIMRIRANMCKTEEQNTFIGRKNFWFRFHKESIMIIKGGPKNIFRPLKIPHMIIGMNEQRRTTLGENSKISGRVWFGWHLSTLLGASPSPASSARSDLREFGPKHTKPDWSPDFNTS